MSKRVYKPKGHEEFRPNTRKIYEDHHGIVVPTGYSVHHVLPVRLGGTHDVSNLVSLSNMDHALAHLKLFEEHGDPRDLCAFYMIQGHTEESRLIACAMGGTASQLAKKERGDANGFQLFSVERIKEIASLAGKIGGVNQRNLGIGIHVAKEIRAEWAKLGGLASCEVNGWKDSKTQSENGKRGGPKNAGFKWCNDGTTTKKYTAAQQLIEPFEDFLKRTGMLEGRCGTKLQGSKFYNDGNSQFMFVPSEHTLTFEDFLSSNNFSKGRLK